MPAKKPSALHRGSRHRSRESARADAEDALRPKTAISSRPPMAVAKDPLAAKTWKRAIALYRETKAVLITAFDEDLLAHYCMAGAELVELKQLRREIHGQWEKHLRLLKAFKPKPDQLRTYFDALAQANALLQRFQGMDARLDSKVKMLVIMEQQLYLTPRSRAGAVPESKPPMLLKDEMEALLDGEESDV